MIDELENIEITKLRQKAEAQLKKKAADKNLSVSESDMLKLIQELQVHQIELEMQNEELKLAKEKTEDSVEYHRAMIENISDVIAVVDKNGINRYKSPNLEKLFGWKPEELVGANTLNNVHPEDLVRVQQIFLNLLAKANSTENIVLRYKCKDNTFKWIELTATNRLLDTTIKGILLNYHDITDRKQAEEALKESDWKFKALFEKGPIGVAYHVMVNDSTGKPIDYFFLDANESYQELTGVDPRGKLVTEAFPGIENDPFDWIGVFGKVARTGETIRFETYLESNKRWYDCVGYQYKPDHFVAAFLEITKRKTAEFLVLATNEKLNQINSELIIAKERAEESDRLKTAFLQNMSHEIRTPMNAICGFSGQLNKPDLSDDKRKSFVSIIQNSSHQLLSIVTDILTISSIETKQEKLNISKVCINNVIVDLLSVFKQQSINQNISLYAKKELTDLQSEIFTDKTKITQILTNLLSNALKFTHEGFIEFGYNLKETELEFYVKDSGIGIKSELHEKIFERFRQADKSIQMNYGGTGLGLSISKGFVELLSGKIWVQSEPTKGATFCFKIPYKPANEIDKTMSPNKQNVKFKNILVAEDEEYNFLYIEELLSGLELKLIHAKDGKETVEICKSNPKIDLILMDIKMPIMTGHEAAKIIKELIPNLPIVAQSAYALDHERAKYEGIFNDYLTKPFNENDLKQMVMKYIDIQKK